MAERDKGKYGVRSSRGEGGQRKLTLEFSVGGLITASVALVLAVIWVFILGVLLGRGYKPEKAVPEIAKVLPQEHGGKQRVEVQQQPQLPMKAEDLKSIQNLRNEGATSSGHDKPADKQPADKPAEKPAAKAEAPKDAKGPAKPDAAKDPKAAPKAEQPKASTPAAPAAGQPQAQAKKPEAAPAKQDAKPEVKPQAAAPAGVPPTLQAPPKEPRFRYVYQVSAYNKRDQAEAQRDKLAAQGVKSSVEEAEVKGTPMYRVLVEVEGTDKDAQAAMAKASKASGGPKPILRTRRAL